MVGDWLGEADQAVVQNHPGARSVVRRREMLETGAQNVRDVLRKVPGVQVQDNNGTGGSDISLNVGVRGLTSRLSPRSTVMIDGVPAAVAPYGQPQLSMMPLSIGNLESIDVVRGAGSVRYGPQNVGGVINFVTRAIPEKFSGEIGTTIEHAGHGGWKKLNQAFLGGTADNGLGVALLYSGVKGADYRDGNNDNDIDDVLLKTHWQLSDSDQLAANFHYYDAYADMPGGLTQAQYDDDPFQSVRDWDNFRGRRKDFSLKYTRQVDDLTQFEVLTYYSDSFRGSSIAARNLRTITSYPRDYHVFAVEPRVSRIFFAGPTTQEVGFGYRYLKEAMNERASQLALVDNVPTVRPGSDGHTYQDRTGGTEASAFYIDDKIDVGNWTITPGIRFEKIDSDWRDRPVLGLNGRPVQEKKRSKDYNEPLPALSLMYHLSDEWKLFANYSESFGSLQYFQLGQGGSGNDTAAGLEPEKAKTYELGTRYDNGSWGGEITLFYIDFDDELQYVSNDVGWTNLGATKHQGIETSGHYDFAALDPRLDGLSVYGSLTYTRATYEGDIPSFKGARPAALLAPGGHRRGALRGRPLDLQPRRLRPVHAACARAEHRQPGQLHPQLHHRAQRRRPVRRHSRLRDLECPRRLRLRPAGVEPEARTRGEEPVRQAVFHPLQRQQFGNLRGSAADAVHAGQRRFLNIRMRLGASSDDRRPAVTRTPVL